MPTNKRESFIFTIMMCAFMVFIMTLYNELLLFGFSKNLIKDAWVSFPLAYVVGMLLDWFIVAGFAGLMAKIFLHQNDSKIKTIIIYSLSMVIGMVFFMSLFGAILEVGFSTKIITAWMHNIPLNLAVALPLQLLIAGPIVRYCFRRLIPANN
jgi:hypothetical protein